MTTTIVVPVKFIEYATAKTEWRKKCFRLDTHAFPTFPGVYVIRFKTQQIPRAHGQSPVIKIGSAAGGIKERFDQYNHPLDVTHPDYTFKQLLIDYRAYPGQKTNAYLLNFLYRWATGDEIVTELHQTNEAVQLELEMLDAYCEAHHELPPANFGFK